MANEVSSYKLDQFLKEVFRAAKTLPIFDMNSPSMLHRKGYVYDKFQAVITKLWFEA